MNTKTDGWQAGGARQLRGAPRWLAERSFRHDDIPSARQFAWAFGTRAHLDPARLADFVLAVSEATASVIADGPGTARVRLWLTDTRAFCEVHGDGARARHDEEEALRRWVLRRLADYVSVASGSDDAWVLLSMTVP